MTFSPEVLEDEGFEAKTDAFLSWLMEVGVRINPKCQLVDLRNSGRRRGVGKHSPPNIPLHMLISALPVAIADFAEGEIVFSLPRASVLNIHTVLPTVETLPAQQAILAMPDWLVSLNALFSHRH
jgi:hypothetical protein